MAISYLEHVAAQKAKNPSLENLCTFIDEDQTHNKCHILSLVFSPESQSHAPTPVRINELKTFVENIPNSPSLGHLLIVQDLNKDIIETLGSAFDIDPMFFACHIHGAHIQFSSPRPSAVILPSKARRQNFLTLSYHRTLVFDDGVNVPRRFFRYSNVPRKVMALPLTRSNYVGLAQQCCSVILTNRRDGPWVGIVLVDVPITNRFVVDKKDIILNSRLFQNGYEDFCDHNSYSKDFAPDTFGPKKYSMLDDLTYYWKQVNPPSFNSTSPSLLSLLYFPLRIVAAEWTSYAELMAYGVKDYEGSTELAGEGMVLKKLESNLQSLQKWGRRGLQSRLKLKVAIRFMASRILEEPDKEEYALLVKDYQHIDSTVDTYGRRLETLLPVVMSMVQIADTRRSILEAENVTRLTNLALVFIPLSFLTGIFGMNDQVSSKSLRLFFAAGVPICLLVFFIAHVLPSINLKTV